MKALICFTLLGLCFICCDDITEVEDISDIEMVVLAPSNNVVLNNTQVTFTWESIEEVDSYHIQVATPSFEEAKQVVVDSSFTITSYSKILTSGDYQWRVRAENSGYTTNYKTQSFSIEE